MVHYFGMFVENDSGRSTWILDLGLEREVVHYFGMFAVNDRWGSTQRS